MFRQPANMRDDVVAVFVGKVLGELDLFVIPME